MTDDELAVPRANRRIGDQLRAELASIEPLLDVEAGLAEVYRRAGLQGAAAIVRALATCDAPMDSEHLPCVLCGIKEHWQPEDHDAQCPWRMAREWVARQAEER